MSIQNFNRLPIIECTSKMVQPIKGEDAFGDDENTNGLWFIAISCPIDGKSLSPLGPFDSWGDAMNSIVAGEY